MKKIFTALFLLSSLCAFNQNFSKEMQLSSDGTRLQLGGHTTTGFYNESKIRIIELTFPNDNFWEEITAAGDDDVMASVLIDGEMYDSVGVRFKGATSDFRNLSEKKSFNISLDAFIDGQEVKGYQTLNLNSNYEDPSSIREIVYNHIGRNYIPALKTNFAQLYINGTYWGPYENVQQLNGDFIREWFLSDDGTRWRAEAPANAGAGAAGGGAGGGPGGGGPGGGGPGGGGGGGNNPRFGQGLSTLNFLGADTSYIPNYNLKKTSKENPWIDLALGTEKLNLLPTDNDLYDNLKNYLDIDRSLWFVAHEILFTDSDGYVSKGGSDYYVYWEAETNRLTPLEYDGNSVMQFQNTTIWSPFHKEEEVDFPLMNRLLASPDLRQRYLAHFRVILEDHFTPSYLDELVDNYAAQIRESIEMDTKRIHSPEEFESEIINIKNHIRERRDFLLNDSEIHAQGLTISEVSTLTEGPSNNESVAISSKVSGTPTKVRLYYGTGLIGTFDRVDMDAVGNGTYNASIPAFPAGAYVRYYVEAISDNASNTITYAPRGAEHDVFVYRVKVGQVQDGEVVINEIMASNDVTTSDQNGEFDDWIELYNTTNTAIDLTGYFLSDNAENLDKYDIPESTMIPANDYLIVWADEDGMQEGLHANFKLSKSGEELFLVNADTLVIDEVTFGEQQTDVAYARTPNGTGAFAFKTPTFNTNNDGGTTTTSLNEVDFNSNSLLVYPNPTHSIISLTLDTERVEEVNLIIFDVYGRLVLQQKEKASSMLINVQHLENGMYYLVVNETLGKKLMIAR